MHEEHTSADILWLPETLDRATKLVLERTLRKQKKCQNKIKTPKRGKPRPEGKKPEVERDR